MDASFLPNPVNVVPKDFVTWKVKSPKSKRLIAAPFAWSVDEMSPFYVVTELAIDAPSH